MEPRISGRKYMIGQEITKISTCRHSMNFFYFYFVRYRTSNSNTTTKRKIRTETTTTETTTTKTKTKKTITKGTTTTESTTTKTTTAKITQNASPFLVLFGTYLDTFICLSHNFMYFCRLIWTFKYCLYSCKSLCSFAHIWFFQFLHHTMNYLNMHKHFFYILEVDHK